ncbi:MAG: alpha/beta hydrolase [Acidobacteriota bacterium]
MEQIGNIFVEKVGNGKRSIILLPGLGCGPSIYDNLKAALQDQYTLYLITVAGFNGTPPVASPVIDKILSNLILLIKDRGLSNPIVIGHSIGGTIVLKLASLHSDLLAGVIIIDAAPWQLTTESKEARREANLAIANEMFDEPNFTKPDTKVRKWIAEMVIADNNVESLVTTWSRADRRTLKEFFVEGRMLSLDLDIKAITVPISVIVPYESEDERQSVVAEFQQAYLDAPYVEIKLVSQARHFVMLDQARATNEIILQWLRLKAN